MTAAACFVFIFVSFHLLCKTCAELRIKVIAGTGESDYSGDGGPGTAAEGYDPLGIWSDRKGNTYFVDITGSGVRCVNATTGIIQTVLGQGYANNAFSSAGGPGTSISITNPWGITADTLEENLYITDQYHVWKYNIITEMAVRYAGPDIQTSAHTGDGGPATSASFRSPSGICMSAEGNVYVTDISAHVVRVITAVGQKISLFAGTPNVQGFNGDGHRYDATDVKFRLPLSCYIDTHGVMFIGDSYNKRVRKIDIPSASALVSTYAGGGDGSPDGIPAIAFDLGVVRGVCGDLDGNIFVAANDLNRVMKIDAVTHIISTFIGNGFYGKNLGISLATDAVTGPNDVYYDPYTDGLFFTESNTLVKRTITLAAPSSLPSSAPSSPTFAPTFIPTAVPTFGPTFIPTTVPTFAPTFIPTAVPTFAPTFIPTTVPTFGPTFIPTTVPTFAPTFAPTFIPTTVPTFAPTFIPTTVPTFASTFIPTTVPTFAPTFIPTAVPSFAPTFIPTTVPSFAPTFIPTTVPTFAPTFAPTFIPTTVPTFAPTFIPTTVPTFAPTFIPTAVPTFAPTFIPTAVPTFAPTFFPTAVPTFAPTFIPTTVPTFAPTFIPTAVPTFAPTFIPTAVPTFAPTFIPTAVPTFAPTFIPTAVPTLAPNVNDIVHIEGTVIISNVKSNVLNNASTTAVMQALRNVSGSAQTIEITKSKILTKKGHMHRLDDTYPFQVDFIAAYYLSYFSGWNSSYLTQVKRKSLEDAVEDGTFEHVLQHLASIHNVTQLMVATCDTITLSADSISSDSSSNSKDEDDMLSSGAIAGIVIGVVIVVGLFFFFFIRSPFSKNENKINPSSKEANMFRSRFFLDMKA
jgi:sugar lactone lactonase YvrE